MSVAEFTEFEKVIRGILSTDNDVRRKAEEIYRKCATNGDKFFTYSVHLLNSSKEPDVRVFNAVMIRQYLSLSNDMWTKVSSQVKELLKGMLIDLFKREENRSMRRKVSNAIGSLAAKVFQSGEKWDVLIPTLLEVWKSPHALHRESVLDIFDVLGEFCVDTLRPSIGPIKAILGQGLTETKEPTIAVAALKATVSLLVSVEDEERKKLVDCIPLMFQCLGTTYKNKENEDPMMDALETLVNLARCQPTFLRPHLKTILAAVVQMATDKELQSETRRMAMEFLLTIAETGKGMVRKIPEYSQTVIPAAFLFMTDLEHTEEWNSGEDEDDSEQQNYLMGMESIERLSFTLGPKIFLKVAWPLIEKFLTGEWVNKHAALMAIAKMVTGCEKLVAKELDKLVKLVVPMLNEKHPRVQWAAVNTIAQLCADFDDIQEKYHSAIIPALCLGMNPSLNPRVIRHATLSIVDFCNSAKPAHILPYVNTLFGNLLKLLTLPNLKIQEAALTSLTATTLLIDKEFVKFYNSFLPGIKGILKDAKDEKHRALRGKAMEAIGVIAKAVGKDVFSPEAAGILKLLVDTQKEGLGGDDPQYHHLVQALARICQCMGPAFLPYLQYVIPPLIKSASINDACIIDDGVETGAPDKKDGFETVSVAIRHVGNKRITINTSLLEEQATAVHALYQYAEALKENFFPYVAPTASALVSLLAYPYNENVRVAAALAAPALLNSAAIHLKKTSQEPTILWKMWTAYLPEYVKALTKEVHLDSVIGLLHSLTDSLKAIGLPLPEKHLAGLNELIKEMVDASNERRAKRDEISKSQDFDEQEKDVLEEENEEEDKFLSAVYYCIQQLVKTSKEVYLPTFHKTLFPVFWPMLAPEKSAGERNGAICIFDDVIAYGGAAGTQYITKFLPLAFAYAKDTDSDVRQSAVWGIGACAMASKEKFLSVSETALDVLSKVITAKDSKTEENEPATENAIGAVAKICKYVLTIKGQESALAKVLPTLVQWLPIKADFDEGKDIHDILCDFIESNNPALQLEKNLPKILSIFGSILGTNAVTEATTQRISKIWKVLCSSVPSTVMSSAVSHIKPEEQEKLKKLSADKS